MKVTKILYFRLCGRMDWMDGQLGQRALIPGLWRRAVQGRGGAGRGRAGQLARIFPCVQHSGSYLGAGL